MKASSPRTLFQVSFHVKGSSRINNSDIDIRISPIGVIQHLPASTSISVRTSDWIYTATGVVSPGQGNWVHLSFPSVPFVAASAFYVLKGSFTAAGFGIEHVPEPGAALLLLGGVGVLIVARGRA